MPALGSVKVYKRKQVAFPTTNPPTTVQMWTRGYLDDACLTFPGVACMSKRNPTKLRPEASAQALLLWVLAFLRDDHPLPPGRPGYTQVDWEVGPTKLVESPDGEPPGDPQRDPCDLAPGTKLPNNWRIDIVVQKSTLIEVKNYANRGEVENQLNCYIAAAGDQQQVLLAKDVSLANAVFPFVPVNAAGAVTPDSTVWCVWVPTDPAARGHAYFARLVDTPQPQQDQCNPNVARGNNPPLDNQSVTDTMEKLAQAMAAAAGGGAAVGAIRKLIRPTPVPAKSRVTSGVSQTYQFDVLKLSDQARLLNVAWGDGTTSTLNVPMGTGVYTASIPKTFTSTGIGVRRLYQSAGVSADTSPLARPGDHTTDSVIAPQDPSFDFVTDVDPAPVAEADPDGDPANTITVSPTDYLADGAQVSVTGTGFTANSAGTLRLCTSGNPALCGNALTTMSTNASGAFATTMTLPQTFSDAGPTIDCAVTPCRVVAQAGTYYSSHHIKFGTVLPMPLPADFDGSGTSDISVFRPSNGAWYVNGGVSTSWGATGDIAVPGDYDGSGDIDIAVFRPSNGVWYVKDGENTAWGASGDLPVPGDYDGNGSTDVAVFRPSNGVWYVNGQAGAAWGASGDIPVPGDYDGDGKADIAVFRPSSGVWFVLNGATNTWGASGDIPVPGDYDGDGKTDIAVFRPSNGTWYVLNSSGGSTTVAWGSNGDVPAPGDYDGDGKTDVAVFRPSNGVWYVRNGVTVAWGTSGDRPLPLPGAIRAFFP